MISKCEFLFFETMEIEFPKVLYEIQKIPLLN